MAYQKVNGCSHPPSKQQIITLFLYLSIVAIHSVYIVPAIIHICHAILYAFLVLHYISLIIIIFYYMWITLNDPVDPVIVNPQLLRDIPEDKLWDCAICGKRQLESYHCKRCGRCSENFDHHCKFLNNCIGSKNYHQFLKLLSMNIIFLPIVLAQSFCVYLRILDDEQLQSKIPVGYWLIIWAIIISAILLILQIILLGFHCYISYLEITTLSYIRNEDQNKSEMMEQKTNKSKLKEIRNSILQFDNEEPQACNEPQESSRNLKPIKNQKNEMVEYNPQFIGQTGTKQI